MEKIQISPSLVLKETRKPLRPLLIKHLVQKKKPVSVRPPEQPPEQWAVIPADQIIVPGAFCLNRPDDTTLEANTTSSPPACRSIAGSCHWVGSSALSVR